MEQGHGHACRTQWDGYRCNHGALSWKSARARGGRGHGHVNTQETKPGTVSFTLVHLPDTEPNNCNR